MEGSADDADSKAARPCSRETADLANVKPWAQTPAHGALTLPDVPKPPGESEIVLRTECLSAHDIKVVSAQATLLQLFVVAIAIIFIVLEATNHTAETHKRAILIIAATFALLCLTVTLFLGGVLVRGIVDNAKAGKCWRKRSKKLVAIIATSVALVMLTCVLWASCNLYAVAGDVTCRNYGAYCKWSYAVQWTMLNTLLLVQLVLAHAPTTWKAPDGHVFQTFLLQRSSWLKDVPDHAVVFDAPWHAHTVKLLPWLIVQGSIITQLIHTPGGQAQSCSQNPAVTCTHGSLYTAHKVLAYTGMGVYMCYHLAYVRLGHKHATIAPYFSFRVGLIMLRTQEGLCGISKFMVACVAWILCTVFQPSPCLRCIQAAMYIVLMLQAIRLIVVQTAFFTPKAFSTTRPIVTQDYLQRFAWTEQNLQVKLERIQAKSGQSGPPMFCFETAIKLLYWCALVYEYAEGRKVEKLSKERGMQLVGVQHMQLMRCQAANVKCLVAWGHGSLLLAFRGTANLTNALADIKAWMVKEAPEATYQFLQPIPKVHSGFHYAWQASGLKQQVLEFVKAHVSAETACSIKVLLTGHSLGGAMANLAAMDLAPLFPWASLKVYTVGAPRVGNHAYARGYNRLVPDSWAIINYRDPVPQMAKFWFLYARPGEKVLLMPHGDMVVCPTPLDTRLQSFKRTGKVANHKLAAYQSALVGVLHSQLKDKRLEPNTDLLSVLGLADNPDLKEALLAADADRVYKAIKPAVGVNDGVVHSTASHDVLPTSPAGAMPHAESAMV